MKYLGIDYGEKRVGVAISDEEAGFAFPKVILQNNGAINEILSICESENISGIVVGESLSSNGIQNEIDKKIKSFADKLGKEISLPIFFQREDFSSVEASRFQIDNNKKDDSAAAIILQRFLDKKLDERKTKVL